MTVGIKRVVKFGRCFRYEHLQGKWLIVLVAFNAGTGILNLLSPWPWKLFSILSVAALTLSIIMVIKANFVTMPDWARDVWNGKD